MLCHAMLAIIANNGTKRKKKIIQIMVDLVSVNRHHTIFRSLRLPSTYTHVRYSMA